MTNGMDRAADALNASFAGQVVRPTDDGYDDARRIWNGHIDCKPAIIARCTGPADVATAVRVAREHELLIAVRGGGHAVAGHALCDDGIVIDLSRMTGARVARGARREGTAGGGELS